MRGYIKLFAVALVGILLFSSTVQAQSKTLLNVSYDPTRELYVEYNALFTKYWKERTGQDVTIKQSHGGSGKQARSVIDGLKADVVTLALAGDVNSIAVHGKLFSEDWQSKLPHNSTPYTSTIVFLVRKGNPKGIKDWGDLVKGDVSIITPNPKTSGGAQWNYLAAWAWALKQNNNDESKAREFVTEIYKRVAVLDTGARGSTNTFVQRGQGDVLLAWENEAYLSLKEFGSDKFDIVYPTLSILAEPPVAVVEKNAQRNGNLELATEYLKYLYSPEAQEIIAKNFYRPRDPEVARKYEKQLPPIELVTIQDFGGWKAAYEKHFADKAIFDQIYKPGAGRK